MEAPVVPLYPKQTSKVSSRTKLYLASKFPAATGSSPFLGSEPAKHFKGKMRNKFAYTSQSMIALIIERHNTQLKQLIIEKRTKILIIILKK